MTPTARKGKTELDIDLQEAPHNSYTWSMQTCTVEEARRHERGL